MHSDPQPSIPPGRRRLSIDEYADLPNDGRRYQILDGELDVTPAPSTRHQTISRRLLWHLMNLLERTGKAQVFNAPVDVVFDRHNVVQPDLAVIRQERAAIIESANIRGAPDLLVEILSPSTRRTDVLIKSELYARFGVPSYWIVDPEIDRVEVYHLREGAYERRAIVSKPDTLFDPTLPEVSIPLSEVFA